MGRRRLSHGTQVEAGAVVLAMLLLLAVPFARADGHKAREQTLLVHVRSLLDKDTDLTRIVPQVIAAAVHRGSRVIVLFDAGGVRTLKVGRWFGGHSTPIDRVAIPDAERQQLAALLGIPAAGLPDIYGSLLHFLRGRGVEFYASKQALELAGLQDRFDHVAEAVGEERIVELLAEAGTYVSY